MADVTSQLRRQIELLKIEQDMLPPDSPGYERIAQQIRDLQRQIQQQSIKTAFGSD